jgi:tryptophanyl-tRNA synthetase
MKKRILTGDRPTGPLHIGHYVGSLENRVRLQDEYDCFFIIADYEVLTDHLKETEHTEQFIKQVLLDWLSVGLDPNKSTFFIQSKIPEIAELTMYFSMMVTLARLQRNPTVKEEFKASRLRAMSYGFLGYPISQAADILIVRPDLVPVGDDNLPHVEQTREIARTFNGLFGEVFPVPEALVGEVPRLPGLDGQKMSKSKGNAIYLRDTPKEVRQNKLNP